MPPMDQNMLSYLRYTPTIDCDHESIIEYARNSAGASPDPVEQAVRLYYAVRDGIRYDPYVLDLSVEALKASTTLRAGRGWCVAKAILLAACCRVKGIPARLGYADVRNHLTTARMRAMMKTDVFHWHGYTSLYLEGKWVKATPAFNIELCEKFRFHPLEFDGRADSVYHPFDMEGNLHMEYLCNRGEYADVPLDDMMQTFTEKYSALESWGQGDFDREVEQETGKG